MTRPRIDSTDELICLGQQEDVAAQGGALTPPIVQTSLFAHESLDDLMAGLASENQRHVYTRGQNPTVEAVGRCSPCSGPGSTLDWVSGFG